MSPANKTPIELNLASRRAKDSLKRALREESVLYPDTEGVILPQIIHHPSRVDRAMQWYFNGFIIGLGSGLMIVDPGVDFYSRFTRTGHTIKQVRTIFVSHHHLDHSADLPVLIDIAVKTNTKIDLFVPVNLLDETLPSYYRKLAQQSENIRLIVMDEQAMKHEKAGWAALKDLQLIRLFHSTPHTFGFILPYKIHKIVYISDTGYAKSIKTDLGTFSPDSVEGQFESISQKHQTIKQALKSATCAIININDLFYNRHSTTHLSGRDVLDMLEGSTVKSLLLQHTSPYDANGDENGSIYLDFFKDKSYACTVFDGTERIIGF